MANALVMHNSPQWVLLIDQQVGGRLAVQQGVGVAPFVEMVMYGAGSELAAEHQGHGGGGGGAPRARRRHQGSISSIRAAASFSMLGQ